MDAAAPEGFTRHGWLEEEMLPGLRNEAEHGGKRPGENASLPARQAVERCDPTRKADIRRLGAVKEIEQSARESLRARRRPDGVPQRHFFEREKQIGSGFDR